MEYLNLDKELVKGRIITNLKEGGLLIDEKECHEYRLVLNSYDDITLLTVLVESHNLKEQRIQLQNKM